MINQGVEGKKVKLQLSRQQLFEVQMIKALITEKNSHEIVIP